ncbi:MAG: hypothetical protein CME13_15720 [Gemmatimonadetes bacterium]|nr:hypothetical protein [Gemmatimonadota bacterium]HCV25969.1 hypothetical protein [Candidatus Latescibacterota bacterium]
MNPDHDRHLSLRIVPEDSRPSIKDADRPWQVPTFCLFVSKSPARFLTVLRGSPRFIWRKRGGRLHKRDLNHRATDGQVEIRQREWGSPFSLGIRNQEIRGDGEGLRAEILPSGAEFCAFET